MLNLIASLISFTVRSALVWWIWPTMVSGTGLSLPKDIPLYGAMALVCITGLLFQSRHQKYEE